MSPQNSCIEDLILVGLEMKPLGGDRIRSQIRSHGRDTQGVG